MKSAEINKWDKMGLNQVVCSLQNPVFLLLDLHECTLEVNVLLLLKKCYHSFSSYFHLFLKHPLKLNVCN